MPPDALGPPPAGGPAPDVRGRAVINELCASARFPEDGGPRLRLERDATDHADLDVSIHSGQGALTYLPCRARRSRRGRKFALIGGWPTASRPSLARDIIEIAALQIDVGDDVMNDKTRPDGLEFIRDPTNGLSVRHPAAEGRRGTHFES